MINRLPWWVGLGGMVLAFIAGVVNAVAFSSFAHQGVTHLTGATTQLGLSLGEGNYNLAVHLLLVIAAFFVGATVSGVLIHSVTLKLGRRYGAALTLESVLLTGAWLALRRGHVAGEYLAGVACGLQNAMASLYSGAILRTTHVTGIFTDLGVQLGHRLRGDPIEMRRVRLLTLVLLGFVGGAIAGGLLFRSFASGALLLPATLTGATGLVYSWWSHRQLLRERAAASAAAQRESPRP